MKPLLLLTLLLKLLAAGPPAVKVTFSPLTKAAYLAARKAVVVTKPAVTFPLKKQKGCIVIPTATGKKVFQDKGVGTDNDDQAQFNYLGFMSQHNCHLIEAHYWERTNFLLVDSQTEKQLSLYGKPLFSPDGKSFAVKSAGIEYGVYPNAIQLFRFEKGWWRQVWKIEPAIEPPSWEPWGLHWISASSLILEKRMWTAQSDGTAFTYSKLRVQ